MSTPDTRAGLATAALVAVPAAVLFVTSAVAVVLLVEAPASGLAGAAWRVLLVDDGAWLTVALAGVAITYAVRPIPAGELARWLVRRALPSTVAVEAGAELRRIRCLRVLPAVLGACLGPASGHAANLAVRSEGAGTPTTEALVDAASGTDVYNSLGLVVGGYLLGAVLAEVTRRRPASGQRRGARLAARRPESYLTRAARLLPVGAVLLLAAFAAVAALVGDTAHPRTPTPATTLATGLLLVVGVPAVQRFVVRRPQSHDDPEALALDDTFRSSAAQAVVGASVAGGLSLAARFTTGIWNAAVAHGGLLPWLLAPVGLALSAAILLVWGYYGSGHPGIRPLVGRR